LPPEWYSGNEKVWVYRLERLVKFVVLGQEYPLHTDAPEEEVQEILDLVKSQLENNSKVSTLMPTKLAVLASLNMAGKFVRLKREFEQYRVENDRKLSMLVEKIENVLR
jgi:cell division protein ZapA